MSNSELHIYNVHQSYTVKHALKEHSGEMTPCNHMGRFLTGGGGGRIYLQYRYVLVPGDCRTGPGSAGAGIPKFQMCTSR